MTKRNKDGTFAKGSSGNPQGRPKRSETELALIQNICSLADTAFNTLKSLLEDDTTPANIRFRAAELVIERTCGKAMNAKELDDYETTPRFDMDSPIVSLLADALTKG